MSAQINHSNTNMAPQGSAVAVSTVPSGLVAVQAILEVQKAAKPQRLRQILASLHYLLTFNTEAQDYHFIVDPVDSAILTGRRIGQLEQLINRITNSTVRLHYTPKTGEMTITTMSESLHLFLRQLVFSLVRENIAGVPGLKMNFKLEKMSQYICCIGYNGKPYGLFLLANTGNAKMAAESIGSVFSDITRNHPSIKMLIRLELGGLDSKIHKDKNNNIEARVHRVAEKSRVQVWVRQGTTFIHDKASSSDNLQDDELRLPLLSENTKDKTVLILKFSDILDLVHELCEGGIPLTGHPDNKTLHACMFPLDIFKVGTTARTAQLLGLLAVEQKARGVESKTRFSSLSGGALATRRGMPAGTTGLGQIKAGDIGRRIHGTTRTSSPM
ncbi:hypothetical protein B0T25DRAFT_633170, partial [Lasiosphaeria hispida]